jgi:galactokinase
MAIDRYVGVAFRERSDDEIRARSLEFDETSSFSLGALDEGDAPRGGWAGYVAGVAWALRQEGVALAGADLIIDGTVPVGAGLSSSAALELALARAFCAASGADWEPVRMARTGQRAENDYVGVSCGIMDQFASAVSEEGCALLLDCRSLETERVPIPDEAQIVVMDTGVRRSLSDSAYNERLHQCEQAVEVLRQRDDSIEALRDVNEEQLREHEGDMAEVAYRRARHVVTENERPARLAKAFGNGSLSYAGELMDASHASLRHLYEVSSPELDAITEAAREHPACHGARLTGAGMGGCAVALIERGAFEDFADEVGAAYDRQFDYDFSLYACDPSAGARLVNE